MDFTVDILTVAAAIVAFCVGIVVIVMAEMDTIRRKHDERMHKHLH